MIKGLHHVGFEVDDLEAAVALYEGLGFEMVQRFEYPAAEFVAAMMKSKKLGGVELFQFNNPSHELVEKIKHHSAFQTDNLETDLQTFLDKGCTLAIPISIGKVVKRYAYVKDQHDNYIELLED
jgi:catechol 2,3-dioxygenase-like lactoylglutathione lyase family enzyme